MNKKLLLFVLLLLVGSANSLFPAESSSDRRRQCFHPHDILREVHHVSFH